jgi:hypothetical protein
MMRIHDTTPAMCHDTMTQLSSGSLRVRARRASVESCVIASLEPLGYDAYDTTFDLSPTRAHVELFTKQAS